MSVKNYPAINYGKEYKEKYIGALTGSEEHVVIPREIDGIVLPLKKDTFKGTDLKSIDFNNCTIIPDYCCATCSNLTSAAIAPGTTSVGTYAFSEAKKVVFDGSLNELSAVGNYAFYYAGYNASEGFSFYPINKIGIGSHAFDYSKLTELVGSFETLSSYAFSNASALTKVHITINGTCGSYAFYYDRYVSDFTLNPESDIKQLNSYGFYYFGYSRSNPTNNIFRWDLRNSSFTATVSCCWSYNRSSVYLMPKFLATIAANTFDYCSNIVVYLTSSPNLASTSAFASNTNLAIVLDYEQDENALKEKTNWSTYAQNIFPGLTGYVGVLPPYTESTGVALTWYSTSALTTEITEVDDPNAVCYAVKGLEREVYTAHIHTSQASITITDGSATYDKFVPIGTEVTIIPAPESPDATQLFMLKVNNVDYTEVGSATVTMDGDIDIIALYWDGEHYPFEANLADNTPAQIKLASQLSAIPDSWHVGDEIVIQYDNLPYKCRLVDKSGKFTRVSDGSTAWLTFEFENIVPDQMAMAGAYPINAPALPEMNSGDVWMKIDPNLREVLEEVYVQFSHTGYYGYNSNVDPVPLKIFLARERDLFDTRVYSTPYEWSAVGRQDEYYQLNNTNEARIKTIYGQSSGSSYYELSPFYQDWSYSTYKMCMVTASGASTYSGGTSSGNTQPVTAFALRFAI